MNDPLAIALLLLLIGAALFLLSTAWRRPSGAIEYPFLAGCSLLAVTIPQAIGIVSNPWMVPQEGLYTALLFNTMCAVAIYLGWGRAKVRCGAPRVRLDPKLGYWIGIVFLIVGLWGFLKLTALSGGVIEHHSVAGNYALKWEGLPVAYSFFLGYLAPGFALISLVALRQGAAWKLAPTCLFLAIQLATIIFLGRRSATAWLGVAVLTILFFSRRIALPRRVMFLAVPVGMVIVFVAPAYRTNSQIDSDHEKLQEISVREILGSAFEGQRTEFWTTSYLFAICKEEHAYQHGVGLYNTFVQYFIPKFLVGVDAKNNLYIDLPRAARADNHHGWRMPYGMVPGGPFSVFELFWYFGCIVYWIVGRFLRILWERSTVNDDLLSQVFYIHLITAAMSALTNDIFALYMPLFSVMFPLWLWVWFQNQLAPALQKNRSKVVGRSHRVLPEARGYDAKWT